jgi:serine/threonine-protein kinase HipA
MNCLICLGEVRKSKFKEYHEICFRKLFGTTKLEPILSFTRKQFFEEKSKENSKQISISGMQPKLAVKVEERQLVTTSDKFTHIIKPSPENYPEAAENEHLTMLISKILKIDTAECGLIRFSDNQLVYITKRFDLLNDGNKTHQEDMMQAMNIHPELFKNAKYEAKSYEEVGIFLKNHSSLITASLFFERVFLNFMVANNDYHLKNISIQYCRAAAGGIKLSPHYDTVNTFVYGLQESEMACYIKSSGGFYPPHEQYGYHTRECFRLLAKHIGINQNAVEKIFNNYLNHFPQILELVNISPLGTVLKKKYILGLNDRRTKFLRT